MAGDTEALPDAPVVGGNVGPRGGSHGMGLSGHPPNLLACSRPDIRDASLKSSWGTQDVQRLRRYAEPLVGDREIALEYAPAAQRRVQLALHAGLEIRPGGQDRQSS